MKLTEAVWEQRNLGVSCIEVIAEKNDSAQSIILTLNNRREKYQVLKIPHNRTDLLPEIQKAGFWFIETLFETEIIMQDGPPTPSICKSLIPNINYHIASETEIARIIDMVYEGNIFSTDRIALDPAFSPSLAGRRYANWLTDMMKDPASYMIVSEYDKHDLGFNAVTDKGTYYDGVLGGLFPKHISSGLGFANAYASYWGVYDMGGRKMRSCVSSNNFTMMQLHLLFGMKIRKLSYCLIRHLV